MHRNWFVLILVAAVIVIAGIAYFALPAGPSSESIPPGGAIQVVAAENFWGSLVSQIGGPHVQVLDIVSDPNADPHEYESNATDARAVARADYVVENGAGYDSWMDKLLGAGASPNRIVLNVASLLGQPEGSNPHFWYNPDYVNQVTARIERDLSALDPADAAYYETQYEALQSSLAEYQSRIADIKQQFGGAKVAATEDVFVYLSNAAGLDLISPPAFIEAVAEGNDPPAASVATFEDQLKSGQVEILVYNEQTVTPLTDNMKKLAADQGIPAVGVTETIQPPDDSFEEWMNAEVADVENALNAKTSDNVRQ